MTPNVFVHRVLVCLVLNRGCYGTIKWESFPTQFRQPKSVSAQPAVLIFLFHATSLVIVKNISIVKNIWEKDKKIFAPTDDDEHVSVCGGLEERRLAGHLAPELAAGGVVHVAQHKPRLRGLVLL